jgi:outer membrane receptor protein involved in Fe transport
VVRNAAASRSQGVELDAEWLATRALHFAAHTTYLDAKYTNYQNVTPTALQKFCATSYVLPYCSSYSQPVSAFQNLSGRPTDYAPKWGGNVSASYEFALPGSLKLTTELTELFASAFFLDPTDDPNIEQKGYTRTDARVSLQTGDGHWAFDVIGKNLNDRTIEIFGSNYPLSLGSTIIQKEQPRNFAFQVRYHW